MKKGRGSRNSLRASVTPREFVPSLRRNSMNTSVAPPQRPTIPAPWNHTPAVCSSKCLESIVTWPW
jgi:hypothetical protein